MKAAIFIPAYEAARTLEALVRAIEPDVYRAVDAILIQDDCSTDDTYERGLRLAAEFAKVRVVRNDRNLGYGGTKKKAYRALLADGFEAIAMLHGDAQYPPESLSRILAPILTRRADIVLGSRVLGTPLRDGMPVYKLVGNRFLTGVLNRALGLRLTDYHTGLRAYSASALRTVDYATCGDGHEISAQLLVRAAAHGLRITEVPVSANYGPASRSCSFSTSVRYGIDVVRLAARAHARRRLPPVRRTDG
jgi:glycosyltransferase involved in cell wall biosynthesis